jgi:hypothetical protein
MQTASRLLEKEHQPEINRKSDMNSTRSKHATAGIVAWEVLLVAGAVLLGLLAAPYLLGNRKTCGRGGTRIHCVSNLKQVALASRLWANDHGDKFPWQVSTSAGGTLELVASGGAYRQFLALSNELTSPKVLACPSDKRRTRADDYLKDYKSDSNVSYFVSLDSFVRRNPTEVYGDLLAPGWRTNSFARSPETILSGDRNITGGTLARTGIMTFDSSESAGWAKGAHDAMGNLVFADGSAQQVSSSLWLQRHVQSHLALTNSARFLIPLVP